MTRLLLYTMTILSVMLVELQPSYSEEGQSKNLGLKVKTVYIDPLYGGKEFGPRFAHEQIGKNITLLIAQKLESLLRDDGFDVYLSRNSDQFISLDQRRFVAKNIGADIYIAIKLSHRKKDCIRLLFPDLPPDIKNKTNQNVGNKKLSERHDELDEIYKRLVIDNKIEESIVLSAKISETLKSKQFVDCVKLLKANDYILENAEMPVVIVDLGVSTDSRKKQNILNTQLQDEIIRSLAESIQEYAKDRSQPTKQ